MQNPTTPTPVDVTASCAARYVDRARHVLGRLLDVERHHQLAGFVGLVRDDPAVDVGRERDEALGREAVAHLLDLVVEAPPLLEHDHPGARPDGGTAR